MSLVATLLQLVQDMSWEFATNLKELASLFSVVYQDFAKYSVPLMDNIVLGNVKQLEGYTSKIKDNQLEEKIGDTINGIGLVNVVKNLPLEIRTWLGKIKEGGTDLSGCEWQKVAIARTSFNPAPVRILDEPTAALGHVAEANLYNMFEIISKDNTTILITHRLGAAKLANEIIVIDNGKVKKSSHNTLINLNGSYAQMYEAQRGWYL